MYQPSPERMTERRVQFPYRPAAALHWNAARPEFAQMVNAASLAMPYLEPYLIRTMRQARPLIAEPRARRRTGSVLPAGSRALPRTPQVQRGTEGACARKTVEKLEAVLADDYARLGRERSLRFNLAYAEGFESMALALGHMLIEDREFLFGGAEPAVASLVLWHFVEEIEHKNVAYGVFEHVSGSYLWRLIGLFYATLHISARTRSGYQMLLEEDGLLAQLAFAAHGLASGAADLPQADPASSCVC